MARNDRIILKLQKTLPQGVIDATVETLFEEGDNNQQVGESAVDYMVQLNAYINSLSPPSP